MKQTMWLARRHALLAAAVTLLGLMSGAGVRGQDFYEPDEERSGWFVRADAAARFGLKAEVSAVPVVRGAGIYENGSVLRDISGRQSGRTWNWSYQSADQVTYDAAGQPEAIVFRHLENVPSTGTHDLGLTSPILEGELVGGFHFNDFRLAKRRARLSFEVGYGYFSLSESMDFQASGRMTEALNAFRLHGVTPPLPPYAGTFVGPGPLLDLNPDAGLSSTNFVLTTARLRGDLDVSFHNFRVGPSFDIDITKRLSAQFGAGWDSLYVDASFTYLGESPYTPNARYVTVDKAQWRPGMYAELLLNYQITKGLQIFAGGDLQYNNDMKFGDSRQEITFKLGSTYAVKGGLSYAF